MHEFAIGEPIQARGRADALNPKTPELPLTIAAVAIRITVGAIGRLLGGLIELAFGEEKTLGAAQILLAARAAFGATFYSSHLLFLLRGDRTNRRGPAPAICAAGYQLRRNRPGRRPTTASTGSTAC